MRNFSFRAAATSWLAPATDRKLHFELVDALYATPKSIFAATLVALAVVGITFTQSADRAYACLFISFLLLGLFRNGMIFLYRRSKHEIRDRGSLQRWERRALLGAWAFALLVGFTGAYTVMIHSGDEFELLINSSVMGYIAGISSRNASRPLISVGQVSLTVFPFAIALFARGDLIHVIMAAFIGILYVSIILIGQSVFENIVSRHNAFHKVERLAKRDVLTDLWNRAAFIELLQNRLRKYPQSSKLAAFILVDLDHFKDVNDTQGHQVGDLVLKETGLRLKAIVKPGDEVGRIGGDEFVLMVVRHDETEIRAAVQSILAAFAVPFIAGVTQHFCAASVGYAIAPTDGTTVEELFRNADLALYEAKKRGRSRMLRHTVDITASYDRRVKLEHDLQVALKNGEMNLLYQPIIDPRSGRAICCEALLRWQHPGLGLIDPMEFIPIAEATGLITSVGAWVLTTACLEATHWPMDISVAVNLSPAQFRRDTDLVETVTTTLNKTGLSPRRLDLEVTESVIIEDSGTALTVLGELRDCGVGISLDDFGTGFSSLSYLNDFPFSKIKIDRKFSQGIDTSARTAAIIGAIAKMTRELRMELIAEGIETKNQLESMLRFRINAMQGFLFCKPLPAHQLRPLLVAPLFSPPREHEAELLSIAGRGRGPR